MQEQIYVGLDMGSSRCQQAVIGSDGTLRFSRVVATSEQHLRQAFAGFDKASVHLEAGELSAWAVGIIGPLVGRVVVSHPRTLAWIARDPLKTDKRDAQKLAELRIRFIRVRDVLLTRCCEREPELKPRSKKMNAWRVPAWSLNCSHEPKVRKKPLLTCGLLTRFEFRPMVMTAGNPKTRYDHRPLFKKRSLK